MATTTRWWGNPLGELAWPVELARLLADPTFRGEGVPRGSGAPVLVIPGFAAGDGSTWLMRTWLARIGHRPFTADITWNVDCSDRVLARLERRLQRIHGTAGRPVALVGHSRGGQLARALGASSARRVARVVALGSGIADPFAISAPLAAAVSAVRACHRAVPQRRREGCLTHGCACRYGQRFRGPLPAGVELTSIAARRDGVMSGDACVVPGATNVEVDCTHTGLLFSPDAYRVIADALAG